MHEAVGRFELKFAYFHIISPCIFFVVQYSHNFLIFFNECLQKVQGSASWPVNLRILQQLPLVPSPTVRISRSPTFDSYTFKLLASLSSTNNGRRKSSAGRGSWTYDPTSKPKCQRS